MRQRLILLIFILFAVASQGQIIPNNKKLPQNPQDRTNFSLNDTARLNTKEKLINYIKWKN